MKANARQSSRVELTEEVPILVCKEVPVPYEVIIERPIENLVENRYFKDVVIEKPVRRVVEVPVEVVKEEKKIIQVPKIVEIPKYVDKPVDKIVEVPKEVVREVRVPVERVVNKEVERQKVRPHRTEVISEDVIVEKKIVKDRIVEKEVEFEVPVYVHRDVEKVVDVEEITYVDKPYEVKKIVEVRKEVPIEKIIEIPTKTIVEKPVKVDRIVEQPYTVDKIVQRKREVAVERVVDVPVKVDRVVEVPEEVRVEVPYPVIKEVERVRHNRVTLPDISTEEIIVPVAMLQEKPYEVLEEIIMPRETVVDRIVEYPRYRERRIREEIEIEVAKERVVQEPIIRDQIEEKVFERIKEVGRGETRVVEKLVELERVVQKPVVKTRVVEVPVEKVVEKRVEVPVEKIVQVPVYIQVPKHISVENKTMVPRSVERRSHHSLKRSVKRVSVSAKQQEEFSALGETLGRTQVENIKLALDINLMKQEIQSLEKRERDSVKETQEKEEIILRLEKLKGKFQEVQAENERLSGQKGIVKETKVECLHSQNDIDRVTKQIKDVESKNQHLRTALGQIGIQPDPTGSSLPLKREGVAKKFGGGFELSGQKNPTQNFAQEPNFIGSSPLRTNPSVQVRPPILGSSPLRSNPTPGLRPPLAGLSPLRATPSSGVRPLPIAAFRLDQDPSGLAGVARSKSVGPSPGLGSTLTERQPLQPDPYNLVIKDTFNPDFEGKVLDSTSFSDPPEQRPQFLSEISTEWTQVGGFRPVRSVSFSGVKKDGPIDSSALISSYRPHPEDFTFQRGGKFQAGNLPYLRAFEEAVRHKSPGYRA